MFREPTSDMQAYLPPKAPAEQTEYYKKNKIVLRQIDLMSRMPNGSPVIIKPEQVVGLVSLATVGHVRAYRKASPLVWAHKEMTSRIRSETPSIWRQDEGTLFYVSISRSPSLIMERNLTAFTYMSWRDGTEGTLIMREQHHATTDCACQSMHEGNNFFGAMFSLVCLPAENARDYKEQCQSWDSIKGRIANKILLVSLSI
jgi:hypothetical protein